MGRESPARLPPAQSPQGVKANSSLGATWPVAVCPDWSFVSVKPTLVGGGFCLTPVAAQAQSLEAELDFAHSGGVAGEFCEAVVDVFWYF